MLSAIMKGTNSEVKTAMLESLEYPLSSNPLHPIKVIKTIS